MPYGKRKTYTGRRSTSTSYRRRTPRKAYRTSKKSRYRRYSNTGPTRALRTKWTNPVAPKQLVKFGYCDTGFSATLAFGTGYWTTYVFRGNSVYDPDYTGVGCQPYGYDELCNSTGFTNFRVTASSIRIYFRPESTYASMRRLHAMIIPTAGPAMALSDISDARMMPYHKETTYDGLTETTKGAKLKHYMSSQRFIPDYSSKDRDYTGLYNGNPGIVWYWTVYFYTEEFDDEEVDIYFDVKINYYTSLTRFSVPQES